VRSGSWRMKLRAVGEAPTAGCGHWYTDPAPRCVTFCSTCPSFPKCRKGFQAAQGPERPRKSVKLWRRAAVGPPSSPSLRSLLLPSPSYLPFFPPLLPFPSSLPSPCAPFRLPAPDSVARVLACGWGVRCRGPEGEQRGGVPSSSSLLPSPLCHPCAPSVLPFACLPLILCPGPWHAVGSWRAGGLWASSVAGSLLINLRKPGRGSV